MNQVSKDCHRLLCTLQTDLKQCCQFVDGSLFHHGAERAGCARRPARRGPALRVGPRPPRNACPVGKTDSSLRSPSGFVEKWPKISGNRSGCRGLVVLYTAPPQ